MRKAYNDIVESPDVSPATWKCSGQENDKGPLKERGMIGNRREGRTESLGPVDGDGRLGVCSGPDRTTCFAFPELDASESWSGRGVDVNLMRSRLTGSRTGGSGLNRVGRPICGPGFSDGPATSAASNNCCENRDPPLEGPGASSPSENGNSEAAAALRNSSDWITWLGARNS